SVRSARGTVSNPPPSSSFPRVGATTRQPSAKKTAATAPPSPPEAPVTSTLRSVISAPYPVGSPCPTPESRPAGRAARRGDPHAAASHLALCAKFPVFFGTNDDVPT